MQSPKISVKSIKRLNLKPNDLVVVELDYEVSEKQLYDIHTSIKVAFPNNRTLVCPAGLKLKLINEKKVESSND